MAAFIYCVASMIVGPLHLRHACKQSAANNSVTDAITPFIHPQTVRELEWTQTCLLMEAAWRCVSPT